MKSNDSLQDRLARYRGIHLSVVGRKSGQTITIPVWFVVEGDRLLLLPVRGSETQWFKNLRRNPEIRISARGKEGAFRARLLHGSKAVGGVVKKFRAKYGAGDVKKYYSNFDVAVLVPLRRG